jgi:hypothetical protein
LLSPYGDPANGNKRCGGTAMVTPVATTDYTGNTAANGSGTDKTAQLTVVAAFGAAGVSWTITNTDAGTVYLTKLQCRGKGVYDFQSVRLEAVDTASVTAYGESLAAVDMPYQDDLAVGAAFADYLLTLYESPVSRAQSVTLLAADTASEAVLLAVDVGARIEVVEPVTAVAGQFFVQSLSYRQRPGELLRVTYGLAPALVGTYWLLEDAASELDTNTILGFG